MSIYTIDKSAMLLRNNDLNLELWDPSLNGENAGSLQNRYTLSIEDFNKLFFSRYEITYISDYFIERNLDFRVVTHPNESHTCFEKAELLNYCDPLNIIKTLYLEDSFSNFVYAVVIPETGCFINRNRLKKILNLSEHSNLKKALILPKNMSFGTCSPLITQYDTNGNGVNIKKIIFDSETLSFKKQEKVLDDFSFGNDHRISLQINYYNCYKMLKEMYPDIVMENEILNLSFKEIFIRTKGKVSINYEFDSINYSTAKFINTINRFGNVTIINDYIEEPDLPSILKRFKKAVNVE